MRRSPTTPRNTMYKRLGFINHPYTHLTDGVAHGDGKDDDGNAHDDCRGQERNEAELASHLTVCAKCDSNSSNLGHGHDSLNHGKEDPKTSFDEVFVTVVTSGVKGTENVEDHDDDHCGFHAAAAAALSWRVHSDYFYFSN